MLLAFGVACVAKSLAEVSRDEAPLGLRAPSRFDDVEVVVAAHLSRAVAACAFARRTAFSAGVAVASVPARVKCLGNAGGSGIGTEADLATSIVFCAGVAVNSSTGLAVAQLLHVSRLGRFSSSHLVHVQRPVLKA